MTGRKNNRTSALGRYLEAASSSSNNGNPSNQLCGAENDLNHKNSNQAPAPAPAPAPQPLYASQALRDTSNMNPFNKNSSNDNIIHPPTTIEQMPPDPDQLHVLSDVTSDSDLTGDDDQTMSLLSREEKISHSSQRGKNPNMNQERPKSFRYLRSQTEAYTNNQQETSNGPSAPSTNKWKDALRRKSKQKSYLRSSQSPSDINKDDNNSKSTSR